MLSLMAVTNQEAAERIQMRLPEHGIRTDLEETDPSGLLPIVTAGRALTHVLAAETDAVQAREILDARLEGA